MASVTPQQQQSINDSGGYYDANGNWIDMSGSSGAGQGGTASTGSGSNTKELAALASLTPLIINMLKGSSQPNPGQLLGTLPGGQDILNGVVGQQQQQAPLRQAVTQQAMNFLPNSAFPGGRPALSPVGQGPAAVTSNGSGNDIVKMLAAGAGGAGLMAALQKLASSASGGGGPLGDLWKKLFGKSGPGIQGNQPYSGGALPSGNPGTNGFTGWQYNPNDPSTWLPSDPGVYYGPDGGGAQPTDPSGGTGIGPGMQDYYSGGGSVSGDAPEPGADYGG